MELKKGQVLYIDTDKYSVVNMVEYLERGEETWIWKEYEISKGIGSNKWLCVEEVENGKYEYSIYEPCHSRVDTNELEFTYNGSKYELYEKGTETVKNYFGNADVDRYESAEYFDYISEDKTTIISAEKWEDEIEFSIGKYIDESRVRITDEINSIGTSYTNTSAAFTNYQKANDGQKATKIFTIIMMLLIFLPIIFSLFSGIFVNKSMEKYLDKSDKYKYVTSITNNSNKKKAKVYESTLTTIDATVKDIIDGVPEGIEKIVSDTESATNNTISSENTISGQNLLSSDNSSTTEDGIGLQTKKEYAYVYKENSKIYVQVSSKEYMNNSGTMYHSRHYHHYYRTYTSERTNPTYTSYAYSARQRSINSRTSSGGGTSSGK